MTQFKDVSSHAELFDLKSFLLEILYEMAAFTLDRYCVAHLFIVGLCFAQTVTILH